MSLPVPEPETPPAPLPEHLQREGNGVDDGEDQFGEVDENRVFDFSAGDATDTMVAQSTLDAIEQGEGERLDDHFMKDPSPEGDLSLPLGGVAAAAAATPPPSWAATPGQDVPAGPTTRDPIRDAFALPVSGSAENLASVAGFAGENETPTAAATSPSTKPAKQPKPKSSGRSKKILLILLLVMALLGGGYALASVMGWLPGEGPQPSSVVPASAYAYVALDLNPSAEQQVAALALVNKFPKVRPAADEAAGKPLAVTLFSEFLGDTEETKAEAVAAIEPWVGDRVGLAALPQPQTPATPNDGSINIPQIGAMIAVEVADKEQAEASLPTLERFLAPEPEVLASYSTTGTPAPPSPLARIIEDYVVVAEPDTMSQIEAAVANKTTLDENETFTNDLTLLSEGRVGTIWADLAPLTKDVASLASMFSSNLTSEPAPNPTVTGRVLAGVHLDSQFAELQLTTVGVPQAAARPENVNVTTGALGTLPQNTTAGLAVHGLGLALRETFAAAATENGSALTWLASLLGADVPSDIQGYMVTLGGTDAAFGLTELPGDDTSIPGFMFRAIGSDPKAMEAAAKRLISKGEDVTLTSLPTADGVIVTNRPEYATGANGTLADDPLFRLAVSEPEKAPIAAFVNVTEETKDNPDWAALKAVGVTLTQQPTGSTLKVRLVVL